MSMDSEWCTAEPDDSPAATRSAVEINPANAREDPNAVRTNSDGTVTLLQPLTGIADRFWRNGSVLRVAFTNGDAAQREGVMQTARIWSDHANIQFVEVADVPRAAAAAQHPDIRISFGQPRHSSRIGTDSRLSTEVGQASMDFRGFAPAESTILHEFGHALGLKHEHQNPNAGIRWKKQVVYDEFASCCGWTRDRVDGNVFQKLTDTSLNYSRFDPRSIMGYTVDASWTEDGFSMTPGEVLSAFDISGIGDWYPFGGPQRATRLPSSHRLVVLTRGLSKRVFQKRWDGARWEGTDEWQAALDGEITGHPGVAPFHTASKIAVVGRAASDGSPVAADFDGRSWGAWQKLGGSITGSPLVLRTDNTDWCFVRGTSGRPFYKQRTGTRWNTQNGGWIELGGSITGGLSGDVNGSRLALAVRGGGTGQAALKWWDGNAWSPGAEGWVGLGSVITGQPTIAWLGSDLHVCARFPDGTPHHLIYDVQQQAVQQPWRPIAGSIIGPPVLIAGQDGMLHLLVRGVSRRIFMQSFSDGSWSGSWQNLGGTAIDSPTAVALPRARGRSAELHVFITGVSNAGFRKVWNGSEWAPAGDQWERLGGYLDWGL